MRIVAISDTHTKHEALGPLPEGDVLIHAGDWTVCGRPGEVNAFVDWFLEQPHKYKILIAGNHEETIDPASKGYVSAIRERLLEYQLQVSGVHYLENTAITLDGVKFYGSPYSPRFHDWGFQCERDERANDVWNLIPDDTDVLITHGPPYGILDKVVGKGEYLGCPYLVKRVHEANPIVHIFGHIHSGRGYRKHLGAKGRQTHFHNVANLDEQYRPAFPVTEIQVNTGRETE